MRVLVSGDECEGRPYGSAGFTVDPAGFAAFYQATARPLFRQLYAMCGDVEEAGDCLQEGYVRAWERWAKVAQYEDPAAWVRTVAWRVAVSRWRQARRRLRGFRRVAVQPDELESLPQMLTLSSALRRLPTSQREAVILHHLVGLSVEEIASQLNAPVGTVKARLSRGRAALAERLEAKDG